MGRGSGTRLNYEFVSTAFTVINCLAPAAYPPSGQRCPEEGGQNGPIKITFGELRGVWTDGWRSVRQSPIEKTAKINVAIIILE